MSTQMPSLFDGLDFYDSNPQPQKKSDKRKSKAEESPAEEMAASENEIIAAEDTTSEIIEENQSLENAISEPVIEESIEPEINATELIEENSKLENEILEASNEEEVFSTELVEENNSLENAVPESIVTPRLEVETSVEVNEIIESKAQEEKEIVEEVEEPIENIEEELVDEFITKETPVQHSNANRIAFEMPEDDLTVEEENVNEILESLPIPGVNEAEAVNDLDQLYRTEILAQDYSAFSGFTFESDSKKKEPKLEAIQAEETISINEIDAEHLDFEFEEEPTIKAEALPEFNLQDRYYTIGEVAALFDVNVSHIRFWTTEFKLKVRTTRKGDRLYNPENIARLRLIHHLVKENGFTIKGAKEKLKLQKSNVSSQIDLKDKLSGLKEKLERIKRNL